MKTAAHSKLSFDEFKLYYEATEKVTDRRIETNRWNYSICIAMLIAIAVIIKWSLSLAALLWVGFAAAFIISVMAVLFCVLWIKQIQDFKELNNAKFAVLNEMAPLLDFNVDDPGTVKSYCPLEKEWIRLESTRALRAVGKSKILALKSSGTEYFIPRAFIGLFFGIQVALIAISLLNWPPTKLVVPASPNSALKL